MQGLKIPTDKVAKVLKRRPGCDVEYVLGECSGYRWSQIFTALVWMGNRGLLYVVHEQPDEYRLWLPDTWVHRVLRKRLHQLSPPEAEADPTMQLRLYVRKPVHQEVQLRGEHFMANGMVLDLSEGGAKVRTSSLNVEAGMQLRLRLFLLPSESPVKVDVAAVRWRKQKEFGVEFVSMQQGDRDRLRALVQAIHP